MSGNDHSTKDTVHFAASGPLRGELSVPADKSISHRSALFGAMGEGETQISGYLDSADTRSTLAAVASLGAELREGGRGGEGSRLDPFRAEALPPTLTVTGVGLRGALPASIDVGNAGTLIRLLPGWLAGQSPDPTASVTDFRAYDPQIRDRPGSGGLEWEWRLDGDDSIRRRPMGRVAEPLRRMGARIECAEGDLPPLTIRPEALRGIDYDSPVASAQVKSCLLIAGLLAEGPTTVREPEISRDHTERMLSAAGAEIKRQGSAVTVWPAERIEPGELSVPGDISSAAFFLVAAALLPGSDVILREVGTNPTRTGILDILLRMGASIEFLSESVIGGEPVADLRVRAVPLRGTEIGGAEIPRAIDELPVIALAACFAEGPTVIRDAIELRRKESDRIETVVTALRDIGGQVEATEDGMVIQGPGLESLRGGEIDSHGDHRIAMLGAIAGLLSREGVTVHDMAAAAVSYPGFATDLTSLQR